MIQFDNVSKRYESGYEALNNVSFNIDDGEMVFLTGHSGAGKSTLLKLIALIERPTRGTVMVNNKNLTAIKGGRVADFRRSIGVIFQDHQLLYDRSVFDNVALPLVIAGLGHSEIKRRVSAALDQVDLLSKINNFPVTLSGGEQQRVGIARAVVNRPALLLADEPTGNLDPALSREIMELFQRFNAVGTALLIATHDLNLVASLGKRVLTLEKSRLVQDFHAQDQGISRPENTADAAVTGARYA